MQQLSSAFRIALVLTFSCVIASRAKAAFVTFSGTGYVSGSDQHLEGDLSLATPPAPTHILSGSDNYGDPDGWSGSNPTGLVGRAFSNSTAFSPPSGYSGPVFFGGGSVTATNALTNEGFHELAVANGGVGGGDSIHWRVDSNGGNTHSNHLFVYFKKAQFDSPWNSLGTITSANLAPGAFTVHTGQVSKNQSDPTDITARWVVQDGSSFYVSQNSFSLDANSPYQTNIAAITGWALYDPTTGLTALDFDETSTFGPQTFTNVQGLGFYIEHEDGSEQTHVDIDSFIVSAVPEPSSLVLLGTGAAALLLIRRRLF